MKKNKKRGPEAGKLASPDELSSGYLAGNLIWLGVSHTYISCEALCDILFISIF